MSKDRQTEARSLRDILSKLSFQQQSGLLNLEYHQRNLTEKGSLYLLAGQPMYARVERVSGQEALEQMLQWQNIRFSFLVDAPRPPANLSSKIRITTATPPIPPEPHASPLPMSYTAPGSLPMPGERRISGSISGGAEGHNTQGLVPQKIVTEQNALLPSLTHRQRFLYFLVNGQRTIGDLARMSGKPLADVEMVISELQQMGLIVVLKS